MAGWGSDKDQDQAPAKAPRPPASPLAKVASSAFVATLLLTPVMVVAGLTILSVRLGQVRYRVLWLIAAVAALADLLAWALGAPILMAYLDAYEAIPRLPGQLPVLLFGTLGLAVPLGLVVGIGVSHGLRWEGKRRGKPWPADDPELHSGEGAREGALAVGGGRPGLPSDGRLLLGFDGPASKTRGIHTAQYHAAIVASTGAGKTRSITAPNALIHDKNPMIISGMDDRIVFDGAFGMGTRAWRESLGKVWFFDVRSNSPYPSLHWSPIKAAVTWEGTVKLTSDLAAASGRGGEGEDSTGQFFTATARKTIAPYLHAAAISNHSMEDLYTWLQNGPEGREEAIIALASVVLEEDSRSIRQRLSAKKGNEASRERVLRDLAAKAPQAMAGLRPSGSATSSADTVATAETLLLPWASPAACRLTAESRWTPRELLSGPNTLYVISAEQDSSRFRPLFSLFVSAIFQAAADMAAESPTGRLDPLLIALLDEIANICPIDNLPELMAASRNFARILPIFQSWGQAESIYGKERAKVLVGNAGSRLFWKAEDADTAREMSEASGVWNYRKTNTTQGRHFGERATLSHSDETRPRIDIGEALTLQHPVLYGHQLPREVWPLHYDEHPELRRRATLGTDGDTATEGTVTDDPDDYFDPDDLGGEELESILAELRDEDEGEDVAPGPSLADALCQANAEDRMAEAGQGQ